MVLFIGVASLKSQVVEIIIQHILFIMKFSRCDALFGTVIISQTGSEV